MKNLSAGNLRNWSLSSGKYSTFIFLTTELKLLNCYILHIFCKFFRFVMSVNFCLRLQKSLSISFVLLQQSIINIMRNHHISEFYLCPSHKSCSNHCSQHFYTWSLYVYAKCIVVTTESRHIIKEYILSPIYAYIYLYIYIHVSCFKDVCFDIIWYAHLPYMRGCFVFRCL